MEYGKAYGSDGYPIEQLPDMFSRRDDLLIILNETLKQLSGVVANIPGGNTGGNSVITPIVDRVKSLQVVNVPLGAANSEVSYQFSIGTKSFVMHARNGNEVRMSTQQGVVAGSNNPYFSLKANTAYSEQELNISDFNQKFYFSCSVANEVLEIIIGV